mgnify:FL=1
MSFILPGRRARTLAQEAVRFWVYEYHVDGVHLSGFAPAELLASDPLLADTKLLAGSWDGVRVPKTAAAPKLRERRWHLGEYNEGFLIDMRRVLKGDEDQSPSHLPDTPESGRVWRDQLYGGDKMALR